MIEHSIYTPVHHRGDSLEAFKAGISIFFLLSPANKEEEEVKEEEEEEEMISFHMPLIMYRTCKGIRILSHWVVLYRILFRIEWVCLGWFRPGCIICNKVMRSSICFVYLLSKGIVNYDFEIYS